MFPCTHPVPTVAPKLPPSRILVKFRFPVAHFPKTRFRKERTSQLGYGIFDSYCTVKNRIEVFRPSCQGVERCA